MVSFWNTSYSELLAYVKTISQWILVTIGEKQRFRRLSQDVITQDKIDLSSRISGKVATAGTSEKIKKWITENDLKYELQKFSFVSLLFWALLANSRYCCCCCSLTILRVQQPSEKSHFRWVKLAENEKWTE